MHAKQFQPFKQSGSCLLTSLYVPYIRVCLPFLSLSFQYFVYISKLSRCSIFQMVGIHPLPSKFSFSLYKYLLRLPLIMQVCRSCRHVMRAILLCSIICLSFLGLYVGSLGLGVLYTVPCFLVQFFPWLSLKYEFRIEIKFSFLYSFYPKVRFICVGMFSS